MTSGRIFCFAFCLILLHISAVLSCGRGRSPRSTKKGITVGWENIHCEDFQIVTDIPWWYDWRNKLDYYKGSFTCTGVDGVLDRYVPMTWGRQAVHNLTVPDTADAILGFNEPNHKNQANIPAVEAAALWKKLEAQAEGKALVGPSAAKCGGDECLCSDMAWFDEFFRHCNGCRVDYLAVHDYTCNHDTTMSYLSSLYRRYGRRIWLTEFACPKTLDVNVQLGYMKAILPRLEASSFVYRYSWFTARQPVDKWVTRSANLFQEKTSALTVLGQYYVNFQP